MSLINKMLKDLETRQNTPLGKPSSRPIFQDLHAVTEGGMPRRLLPVLLAGVIVLALVAAVYVWRLGVIQLPTGNSSHDGQNAGQPAVAETAVEAPATPTLPATTVVAAQNPAPESARPVSPPARVTQAVAPPAPRPAPVVPKTMPAGGVAGGQNLADAEADGGSIEKKHIPLTSVQTAENTYRAAAQQLQQRHLDEAEKGFRSALVLNPRHIAAREQLAGLLLERARMDEAQQVLEQGLVSVPGQPGFATLLARIYVEQGAEPKAITLLEQQRTRSAADPEMVALLAALYQRAARHGDAIAAYKEALAQRPLEGRWWLGMGISQEAEQNWMEARFAYERVRDTNVDSRLMRYAEQRLLIVRTK